MSLGALHSAVIAGGKLYLFGSNDQGQLGLGTRGGFEASPWVLTTQEEVTTVTLGGKQSFIAGGKLYAFGANAEAQLGLGDTVDRLTPHLLCCSEPGLAVTTVVFGQTHGGFVALILNLIYLFHPWLYHTLKQWPASCLHIFCTGCACLAVCVCVCVRACVHLHVRRHMCA